MNRTYYLTVFVLLLIIWPSSAQSATLQVPLEYSTIQSGINAAAVGDTVLLDPGFYHGDGNRDLDFLGKDITVRSRDDDPATCIISCQGYATDIHQGFVFQSGETPQARLEGVTISGAYQDEWIFPQQGGAITCLNSSSPTIKNCRLTNCFSDNGAGGLASNDSSPTLIDCRFDNNSSNMAVNCIYAQGNGILTMIRCKITNNDHGYDNVFLDCSSSILFQCTFANNSGLALLSSGYLSLIQCTIVDNLAGLDIHGPTVVENTLIAFNEMILHPFSNPVGLACCNVFGNQTQDWDEPIIEQLGFDGNISADPLLCDPNNWDYRVAPESPCLNELCGQIGAWGEGECSDDLSPVELPGPVAFGLRGNYPNPFNPSTTIRFDLDRETSVNLTVFDVKGKLVRTLIEGAVLEAGPQQSIWNGRDNTGRPAPAGIFLYVLDTPRGSYTGRMALIK